MAWQARALGRLRRLILGLTAFLLVFSVSGVVLLDVYLLSSVSETRLHFLDRTLSYFQNSIKARRPLTASLNPASDCYRASTRQPTLQRILH